MQLRLVQMNNINFEKEVRSKPIPEKDIKSLKLKLEHEESQELVAGHPEVLLYLEDPWFLGACLGPFAGRIKRKNSPSSRRQ